MKNDLYDKIKSKNLFDLFTNRRTNIHIIWQEGFVYQSISHSFKYDSFSLFVILDITFL